MAVIEGRTWLELLSPDACRRHLTQEQIGRVAVVVDGHPEIFPVNYLADDDSNIWFRTAPGTKLGGVDPASTVAFEIDGIDEDYKSGWSVLVVGDAHEVADHERITRAKADTLAPWAGGEKDHFIVITPTKVTGRRIHQSITGQ
jgi:nitroimidazol reductase NimA-like FMN-containing flavoprotein (pyridoxamine 5'-phosphate oxidase superfamily)